MQRDAEVADPAAIDMHRMGTVANIVRYLTAPDGTHHLVCQGEQRFQIGEYLVGLAVPGRARACKSLSPTTRTAEIEARFVDLKAQDRSKRSSCCRRRRPNCWPPCSRSRRRRRSPISPSPTWT